MSKNQRRAGAFALCMGLMLAACATPQVADATKVEAEVRQRVELLLNRYASNDQDGVVEMLDPAGVTLLGTDLAEVIHTPAELRALMTADFRLWTSAKFTDLREFDFRGSSSLATAFFVVSFSAAGGPPIPIRINTTWRKVGDTWFLSQSANSVPTVGQSVSRPAGSQ
jgi:hypothetical protein